MPKKRLKPGQIAPASGQYETVGPKGGRGNEVTMTKGRPLPPAPRSGSTYKLKRRARNKSGRGK
jgi:hypothetical protein